MSSFKNAIEDLKNFDVGDITDVSGIGTWPGPVKFVLALLVLLSCISAGYFLHIQNLQIRHQTEINRELSLIAQVEQKAHLAVNLEEYRIQTAEMEAEFAKLLGQLPTETEVPGLVDDITDTGLGSGLEFANIELSDEVTQQIYIELPINIDVSGTYHDFGTFVSGVASLPRIVTLHDFTIVRKDATFLDMKIMARTYRYKNDENEIIVSQ